MQKAKPARRPETSAHPRILALAKKAARRRLDAVMIGDEANVRALTGVACDNARLVIEPRADGGAPRVAFYTDFRYVPAVKRTAPELKVADFKDFRRGNWKRIGFEGCMAASDYLDLKGAFPRAKLVDVLKDVHALRAVKTPAEIAAVAAAEALNDEIWARAQEDFKPGMTEKEMQRAIRAWMNALGDGEAFETIVCAGANAAECHHVPDDTPWRENEPLLVDMGVKLAGVCADMTRCVVPRRPTAEYRKIYALVLAANRAAVAAVRPGITGRELDKVARDVIRKAGYGKAFGHALGHGVGYEIHEAPTASAKSDWTLEPGMLVTIEPGVYLPGKLGVRIEDLVLVTKDGCEVLSHSAK